MLRSVLLLLFFWACGGDAPTNAPTVETPNIEEAAYDTTIPTVEYTWDPTVGDASVSAEDGGPGFTGEGWETRTSFHASGSKDAIRGGDVTVDTADWPPTLRVVGKDANTYLNYRVLAMVYMPILALDPITLEYVPSLATHWQISEDETTYRFRLNPAARWSDGQPVVAEDVVRTWQLYMDPTLLSPMSMITWEQYEEPKAISKYIVEVKAKEPGWKSFSMFAASFYPFPAHELGTMTGGDYLDKYQFAYTAVNGPYIIEDADIVTGKSITARRRTDWWAEGNPAYTGLFNFESFKFVVIKEPGLTFEKVKKGEVDYWVIPKAQWWADDLPKVDAVKRGLLARRKFYNDAPSGTAGLALNMSRPPLDDLHVRTALQLLYDRKTMIEKLYYNEYEPITSYWQYGAYQNHDNKLFEYDEFGAVEQLEAAGWTDKNDDGYRVKDGVELGFSIQYRSPLSERSLTIFQEACKRAGIRIELELLTPASMWKNLQEKEYEITAMNWGAVIIPNPETAWHSSLASQKNNNNVTAFVNEKVDALIADYKNEYDIKKRAAIIREIDALVYETVPYVLSWYRPAERVVIWNKFSMPHWGINRHLTTREMLFSWWIDPEKEKALEAALADPTKTMDPGPVEHRFWEAWKKANPEG